MYRHRQPVIYPTAQPLDVEVPYRPQSLEDGCIDDIWTVVVDKEAYTLRANAEIDIAIYLTFWPLSSTEPIQRNDPLSLVKLLAEGQMEELKIILAWIFDTIHLKMKLPKDKAHKWKTELYHFIKEVTATPDDLKYLAGKLNTVGYILPASRHFSGRIYRRTNQASHHWSMILPPEEIDDMKLWTTLLDKAASGVSINNVAYRKPDVEAKTDASEHGIGGFTSQGMYWR